MATEYRFAFGDDGSLDLWQVHEEGNMEESVSRWYADSPVQVQAHVGIWTILPDGSPQRLATVANRPSAIREAMRDYHLTWCLVWDVSANAWHVWNMVNGLALRVN